VLAVLPHAHWIISATRCTQCFWCRWCPARSFFHLFDFYQRLFPLTQERFYDRCIFRVLFLQLWWFFVQEDTLSPIVTKHMTIKKHINTVS